MVNSIGARVGLVSLASLVAVSAFVGRAAPLDVSEESAAMTLVACVNRSRLIT
jgi:hypothetical protein